MLSIAGWGVVWFFTATLVFAMGAAGLAKFDAGSGWAAAFANWGFPVWFRLLIGVLEAGAALLLLWPRTAPLGAMIVIVVMLGGVATHLISGDGRHGQNELGPILFATIVLVGRRHQVRALIPLRA
jgi:hypothetical protein